MAGDLKIAVVTARYSITGVPLAQLRLAEAWRRGGAAVETLFGEIGPEHANMRERRGVIDLAATRALYMLPKLMRYFRQQKPDIVFSAEDHLNVIVLLAAILVGSRARICCSSRVTPFDTYGRGGLIKRLTLKWMMKAVMWRASLLTCVSKDMVGQYRQVFGERGHVCVYNIVDKEHATALMDTPVFHPWFESAQTKVVIAAGSLEPWKGFGDLVRCMTIVQDRAKLLILGEGSERPQLEELIRVLGLSQRVQLLGQVDNPLAHFSKAHVFALSSRLEGMPNVLVEAMMCGCTPVAMDCPTGPRELLADSQHGHLVALGDWEAMGAAINKAIDSPAPPEWLDTVVAPFAERTVIACYSSLLGLAQDQLGRKANEVNTPATRNEA